ncbi:MAG: hypothetical protein P1U29_03195 [Candidatus Pelagibacter bacterium]|jgi:ATP-dependent Zn protease|nr:hypothetical protein [Candidatus Pelagibacter bacterium]
MEEVNNILNPPVNNQWDEAENFATETAEGVVAEGKGIIKEVYEGAKETLDMVVDESKTIAPDVVEVFKESSERVNSKPRVISPIPNNILVYGLIGVTSYIIIKKFL